MRTRAVGILMVLVATACVLVAPGVARADNPQLQATLDVFNTASLPPSADAVTAGTVFATMRQDIGYLSNLGSLGVTGGMVHFAPSSGVGPADATGDIPAGLSLNNTFTGAGTENVYFDADRSLAAGGAPAGLSHQTLTLHVTPGDAPLGTSLASLVVEVFGNVGSLTASNYTLDSGPGGADTAVTEGRFHINWSAVPHTAYTLVIGFDVTNPSAGTYAYKPEVSIQAAAVLPSGSTAGATSVSQTDPQTGTMTYSVNEVSDWTQRQSSWIGVSMGGVADPPAGTLPQAQATALALRYVNLSPSDDTVADQSYIGHRGWRGDLQNFQSTVVPGPRIQLDTVDSTTWTFDPPPALPADTGLLADLGQGQQASLHTVAAEGGGTSGVDNTPITTGYYGSRSMSPASVNAGDVQTETISITLQDPSYDHGFAEIDVFPHDPSSASNGNQVNAASAVAPTLSNGESLSTHPVNGDGFAWQINNAHVGATYTLQVPITVATTGVFKPFVALRGGTYTGLPQVTGTSTTIHDSELGGTWTYSSTAAGGVTFNRGLSRVTSTNLQALIPAGSTPDYAVSLDQSEYTVHAGGQFSPTVTLAPLNGFSSQVGAFICTGTGPGQYAPSGFFQQGAYLPQQVGPAATSFQAGIGTSNSLAPGDYTFGICTYTASLPLPNKLSTFTVHVLAGYPDANAAVYRTRQVWVGNDDTVTNTTQTLRRSWGASIYNWSSAGTVHAPSMSLDGASAVSFSPPFASFPVTSGTGGDLGPNGNMFFNELSAHQPADVTASPGYSASRTLSPQQIPSGGGVQDVTISITPQNITNPDQDVYFEVQTDNFGDAPGTTIVPGSVQFGALTHGETSQQAASATYARYDIEHATNGVTYTLQLQVQVANGGPTSDYKPWARVGLLDNNFQPSHEGTSVSMNDSILGGNFSFQSTDVVNWHPDFVEDSTAYFQQASPAGRQVANQQVYEESFMTVPAAPTNTVDVTPHLLQKNVRATLWNFESSAHLANPSISLDGPSSTSSLFTPSLLLPAQAGQADLAPGAGLTLDPADSGHNANNVTRSLGFAASRTMSATTIPSGGGDVDVTLSITPTDASLATGYTALGLAAANYGDVPGATVTSTTLPTLGDGEGLNTVSGLAPDEVYWSIGGAVPGKTYTLHVTIHVPNTTGHDIPYVPFASASAGSYSPSEADGTSITMHDPLLNGDFTFGSTDDVHWDGGLNDSRTVFFDGASEHADFTVAVDHDQFNVHAGDSFSPQLTLTPVDGFTGPITFWLTTAGADPPSFPSGFYQLGSFPTADLNGTDPVTVTLPINTDSTLPPGTYNLEIGSNSGVVPDKRTAITVVVSAALPSAFASDLRNANSFLPANVDSSLATSTTVGNRSWLFDTYNEGPGTVTSPAIHISGTSLTFSPALGFPLDVSGSDLATGDELDQTAMSLFYNGSEADNQPISNGFDITRSMSPAMIPAGGGVQTVTLTITARDPALANGYVQLFSETNDDIDGTAIDPASVTWPTVGPGVNVAVQDIEPNFIEWTASNPQVGVPYTLTYRVSVPNTGATPLAYKPIVTGSSGVSQVPVSATGTSVTINDAVLGGDITYSSGNPVQWQTSVFDNNAVILGSDARATTALTHFAIRFASATATAGSPVGVTITALDAANHTVMNYAGPVRLDDSSGSGVFDPVSWSHGVGTTTLTVPSPALNERVTVYDDETGGTVSTLSGTIQVLGGLDHFKVAATPATAPTTTAVGITVTPMDALNHVLTTFTSSTLTLADSQSASGTTFGLISWSHGIGTATASFTTGVRNDTIVATDGLVSNASNMFSRSAAATRFVVSVLPANVPVAGTATIKVIAYDAAGNVATGYTGAPTLTDLAGVGSFASVAAVNGISTSSVSFTGPAKADKVTAVDGALTSPASNAFNVIGGAARLAVSVLPANVPVAGTATAKVTAYDGAGNVATGYTGTPTLTDLSGVASFTSAAAVNGISTSSVSFTGPAKADKVTAVDGALTSPASNAFNVIGGAARLAVSVLPANVPVAGTATAKVTAYDGAGNVATGYTGTPTLSDLAGVGSFGSVAAINGVSTSSVSFTGPAKADKVTADDGTLTSPASNVFNVIGDATRLTATVTPANVSVAATAIVRITAYDGAGNVATGYIGAPTLTDTAGVGVFAVPAPVNGVVAAATMNFTGPAKADKVTPHDGALATAASNAFNVIGPAVSFRVVETPTTVARTALATVTTQALDAAGNVATGYVGTVTYSDNLVLPAVAPGPFDQVNTNGVIVAHVSFTRGPVTSLKIVVTDTTNPSLTGLSNAFRIT